MFMGMYKYASSSFSFCTMKIIEEMNQLSVPRTIHFIFYWFVNIKTSKMTSLLFSLRL